MLTGSPLTSIEYDPVKDAVDIQKHRISLSRAADIELEALVVDERFAEPRLRLHGLIDGLPHCAAATRRGDRLRIISLRRAHAKADRRHV